MFAESDLLPISAVQHLAFCPRQCALIHVEGLWADNRLTAQGRILHEKVHDGPDDLGQGVRTVRGLALRSLRLGLAGIADVVEFHPVESQDAAAVPGWPGRWRPRPVEYKRGRPKADPCDEVQLCAQAACLEEMLSVCVPEGSLFYGAIRRRIAVALTPELRRLTAELAAQLHEMIRCGRTPPPEPSRKCRSCSLASLCMPKQAAGTPAAGRYFHRQLSRALSATATEDGHEDP
jgi:CRISPR-associated exonuclease Cas4